MSADVTVFPHATEDLAHAIVTRDVKLSDIQVMQSIILEEEVAQYVRDVLKTIQRPPGLDLGEMSMSMTRPQTAPHGAGLRSRGGSFSKQHAQRITACITDDKFDIGTYNYSAIDIQSLSQEVTTMSSYHKKNILRRDSCRLVSSCNMLLEVVDGNSNNPIGKDKIGVEEDNEGEFPTIMGNDNSFAPNLYQ